MPTPQMTTAEALRSALASTIACSAQELQEAVGQVVVATAAELPSTVLVGPSVRSVFDAATRHTVLLADRIPAGQEAQALASEIARHHGRLAAQAVLGDRASELLGSAGKVKLLIPNRFQVFKVSLCGNQIRRDYTTGLTLDETRAYPLGKQSDANGDFMWGYSLTDDYPKGRAPQHNMSSDRRSDLTVTVKPVSDHDSGPSM